MSDRVLLSPFLFGVYADDIAKLQNNRIGTFIILYANDVLLLARSVTTLQKLLSACEQEFESIDMAINIKKSSCLHIGAIRDKLCSSIHTLNGREFDWVNEVCYLGVHIVHFHKFTCSVDQAKWSFYRAANTIFAKVGRLASEEVMVQLLKQKCLPILLYALDVCNLNKRTMQSLDFTINRFFYEII